MTIIPHSVMMPYYCLISNQCIFTCSLYAGFADFPCVPMDHARLGFKFCGWVFCCSELWDISNKINYMHLHFAGVIVLLDVKCVSDQIESCSVCPYKTWAVNFYYWLQYLERHVFTNNAGINVLQKWVLQKRNLQACYTLELILIFQHATPIAYGTF